MEDSVRSISFLLTVSYLVFTAGLWSGLINGVVPDPYLVSLAPEPSNIAHVIRMRSFMSGKHKPTSAVNGTSGTLSLRLLLACGFHRMLRYHGLILSKRYLATWVYLKPFLGSAPDFRHGMTALIKTPALRSTNLYGSFVLAWLVYSILLLNIKVHDGECEGKHGSNVRCRRCPSWSSWELSHTTVNVFLFPPLFFFYGLYYTDVLSVVSVLYAYQCYLEKQTTGVFFAGLLCLLFRQTNIFWVSVFLGGLELCRIVPKGRPNIEFPSQPTYHDIIRRSWHHASAYDPMINQACFEGHDSTPVLQRSR